MRFGCISFFGFGLLKFVVLIFVASYVSADDRPMKPETIYQAVAGRTHGWRLPLDINVCDPSGPVHLKPGEPWPDIVIVAVAAAYQRGRSLRQRWFSASGVAEDYNYVYLEQDLCRYRHWFLVPGGGGLLTATRTNGAPALSYSASQRKTNDRIHPAFPVRLAGRQF